ncbi:hypothetical protein [Roseovarius sp. EL26]|nr:hypothetical protein [Roseovarius sp. EL26]
MAGIADAGNTDAEELGEADHRLDTRAAPDLEGVQYPNQIAIFSTH